MIELTDCDYLRLAAAALDDDDVPSLQQVYSFRITTLHN